MPHRAVKQTDKGTLGDAALGRRVTGKTDVKQPRRVAPAKPQQQEQTMEIDQKDPYEKIRIDQNNNEDDIICDVCLDDDDDENNEIVICDLCLVATHQSCYGSELLQSVPQGSWYCARCRDLLANRSKPCTEIQCILCPKIDGVMKPV